MYELIILSRLMRHPSHGYRIAKIINDMIGPYAKISNGRFYPLLARLEQDGLIEVQQTLTEECYANNFDANAHLAYKKGQSNSAEGQHGDRQSRHYIITELGRKRHHQLMLDTTSNPGEYSKIFLHKVFTFDTIQPEERLYLIDHYINYCQAHILHLRAEAEDLAQNGSEYGLKPAELATISDAHQHLQHQWRVELEWARQLQAKELAAQNPPLKDTFAEILIDK